jgi:transposase, IS5 family
MHLSVDTKSELPMAIEVTPAHMNDGDVAPQLIEQVNQCVKTKIEYLIMDAGYDQLKNYESAKNIGAQAIIPLNLRNEKEPPAGIASNGTPRCSMGYNMTYWGTEKNQLKFRCPHATGKVDCPLGMTACSSSNYGIVVKVNTLKDLRRYSIPHRDTKRWKEPYKERTSVERCNSRMKCYLTANSLHVRGIEKVKTHIYLNAIVLIASALAMNKQSRKQIAI